MENLTRASEELFRRGPDECFATFEDLWCHCQEVKSRSVDRWHGFDELRVDPDGGRLRIQLAGDGAFGLNDWSFSQLCSLARVSKDTVNKLSPQTAYRVLEETLPRETKPLQFLTAGREGGDVVRSIHGASYTRLYDAEVLSMVREYATDFRAPQEAAVGLVADAAAADTPPWEEPTEKPRPAGGTGLYRGEQDMFVFLIDPTGWAEIGGEAFAPGFFLWNSEVGKRSVGIQTFWFQAVCQNHIVWDAVEVVEFSRKHTANVHEAFDQIRRIIDRLVSRRDERRDGFARVIRKAMETKLGETPDQVLDVLGNKGITRALAKEALEIAKRTGRFTVFSLVDALTRLSGEMKYAGERTDADAKAGSLLTLAA